MWFADVGVTKKDMTHTGIGRSNALLSEKRESEVSFSSERQPPVVSEFQLYCCREMVCAAAFLGLRDQGSWGDKTPQHSKHSLLGEAEEMVFTGDHQKAIIKERI